MTARPGPGPVLRVVRAGLPWLAVVVLGGVLAAAIKLYFDRVRGVEPVVWRAPRALWLLAAVLLVGALAFHLRRRRIRSGHAGRRPRSRHRARLGNRSAGARRLDRDRRRRRPCRPRAGG